MALTEVTYLRHANRVPDMGHAWSLLEHDLDHCLIFLDRIIDGRGTASDYERVGGMFRVLDRYGPFNASTIEYQTALVAFPLSARRKLEDPHLDGQYRERLGCTLEVYHRATRGESVTDEEETLLSDMVVALS